MSHKSAPSATAAVERKRAARISTSQLGLVGCGERVRGEQFEEGPLRRVLLPLDDGQQPLVEVDLALGGLPPCAG
jgi:hypothetical protein